MTHADEKRLYDTDRDAWARYVAPRWASALAAQQGEDKRRTWAMAGPELKRELRRLAASERAA